MAEKFQRYLSLVSMPMTGDPRGSVTVGGRPGPPDLGSQDQLVREHELGVGSLAGLVLPELGVCDTGAEEPTFSLPSVATAPRRPRRRDYLPGGISL